MALFVIWSAALATLFVKYIFCLHGLLKHIVSDTGDTIFLQFLKVKLVFSLTYHLQSNTQVEHTNQIFVNFLRKHFSRKPITPPPAFSVPGIEFKVNEILNDTRSTDKLYYIIDWNNFGPNERGPRKHPRSFPSPQRLSMVPSQAWKGLYGGYYHKQPSSLYTCLPPLSLLNILLTPLLY